MIILLLSHYGTTEVRILKFAVRRRYKHETVDGTIGRRSHLMTWYSSVPFQDLQLRGRTLMVVVGSRGDSRQGLTRVDTGHLVLTGRLGSVECLNIPYYLKTTKFDKSKPYQTICRYL